MKIESLDTHRPDLHRRRLLAGLSSGLALASPLAFVACGGGDSSADAGAASADSTPPDPAIVALAAKLPPATRTSLGVKVALPAGAGGAAATMNLVTGNNVSEIRPDGSAGVVTISGAPQMAYVLDGAGRLLLMGVVENNVRTTVDSRSTAEALLLLTSEAYRQGPAVELAIRRGLARSELDPVVEPVRLAVEAALGRNGVDPDDTALMDAVKAATLKLRMKSTSAPARHTARPQSLTISPDGTESGITIQPTDEFNTVTVKNQYRRRTRVTINRVGTYDAAGTYRPEAPVKVEEIDLDTTTALSFDSLVAAVGDYVARFLVDIGWLGDYETSSAFAPITSEPVSLPNSTDPTAKVTVHEARVVGIGAVVNGTLTDAENARYDAILGTTLWEDIAKPFIRTIILPLVSEKFAKGFDGDFEKLVGGLFLTTAGDLTSIAVSGSYFPATAAALRAGDAKEVAIQFATEFFSSNTWQLVYETAMRALVQASLAPTDVRDGTGALVGVNLLDQETLVRKRVEQLKTSLGKLARVIQIIKVGALVGDYTALAHDWLGSTRLTEFTLKGSKAVVKLTPSPLKVIATAGAAGTGVVTANVSDLDTDLPADKVFLKWTCTGRYGNLFRRGGAGTDDFESPLTNPTHDYIPTGVDDDPDNPDVITVAAFFRNPTTAERIEMGSARIEVTFRKEFTIIASPASKTTLPKNIDLPLLGLINEVLPTGATVDWTWSHGGVGALGAAVVNANPRESHVTFSSGASEGAATATVSAKVNLPATGTTAARVVACAPVQVPLAVIANTKTISFQCGGGVFACGPTCGVTDYTAFIVPKIAGALLYQGTFSDFGYGPCNRSVTWTSIQGDGGGCNFPITGHPFSEGTAAKAWAVWIGFGGPLTEGKFIATITVPA